MKKWMDFAISGFGGYSLPLAQIEKLHQKWKYVANVFLTGKTFKY